MKDALLLNDSGAAILSVFAQVVMRIFNQPQLPDTSMPRQFLSAHA
jgi:hypothetical protein